MSTTQGFAANLHNFRFLPRSIGGRVVNDGGNDGLDENDEGLQGWIVTLYRIEEGSRVEHDTVETTPRGVFHFDYPPAGGWQVCVTKEPGWTQTHSLPTAADNCSTVFGLDGSDSRTLDFTYVRATIGDPGTIGDRVWVDTNGDGAQDEGEPGLEGLEVRLFANGRIIDSTKTGPGGRYLFAPRVSLDPETYKVCVAGEGYQQTHDVDFPATPNCSEVTLGPGESRSDVDFGYAPRPGLGDLVWHDVDGDGVQDQGEPGLSDWVVRLYRNGLYYRSDKTARPDGAEDSRPAGSYFFDIPDARVSDSFRVCVSPRSDHRQTFDLDFPGSVNCSPVLETPAWLQRNDLDFGYQKRSCISGSIWHDLDADGVRGPADAGFGGWSVQLTRPDGTTASVITGSDGSYKFDRLISDTHIVCIEDRAGYQLSVAPLNSEDGCAHVHVTALECASDVSFGVFGSAEVRTRVWHDADGDGTQDYAEPGLTGHTVTLSSESSSSSQLTGLDGQSRFPSVPPGTYTVCVAPPAEARQTWDLDGLSTPNCATLTLASGQRLDVDFGYQKNGSIGGRVWQDLDADGAHDRVERPLAGVQVTLRRLSAVIDQTVTDANGGYAFGPLDPGKYSVCMAPPPGYTRTRPTFSDCYGVYVSAGQNRPAVNFGVRPGP